MPYQQVIETCFDAAIGEGGLCEAAFAARLAKTAAGIENLRSHRAQNSLALLALPEAKDDLAELTAVANRHRQGFQHIVLLGTGGSSLGGQTLAALCTSEFGPPRDAPRLYFLDNIDPKSFTDLFSKLPGEKTAFLVISKSGGTAETLAQFFAALDWMRTQQSDAAIAKHFTIVTEPGDNVLRRQAKRWSIPCLDHDPGIGGRFSVLSLVGLLPAMIAGVDPLAVREGARQVLDATLGATDPAKAEPAIGAALHVALAETKAAHQAVFMPYCDRLAPFGLWHRQLWAESLGKAGHGTTPVCARGTVDQHSQLQLYLDGPRDKFFTLLLAKSRGKGPLIPKDLADDPALDWLAGRKMGDLLAASGEATAKTLAKHGRPVRRFDLPAIDENVLGALLMHFMLETMLTADLLGVDAFTQPAVEESKCLTRDTLKKSPSIENTAS